jgi:hypothetical protein
MISRSPINSIFSPQSSSRSHAVWLHDLHGPPSAVPALVPLHFAARISLLGLQQVASIHVLRSHDTTVPDTGFSLSSLRMLASLQPSYAFHPHHGPPILRSHDTRGSRHRFQRPSLWQRSSLSYDFLPHPCSQLSMLFGCTSYAVPDIGSSLVPLHFGSSTTIQRLHSRKRYLARPKLRRRQDLRLPLPTMTFTIDTPPMSLSLACG